ncbi:MAG: GatB/YqeY domain-containing protein [Pseudomonadota bacterium]
MLRAQIESALKDATKAKEERRVRTLRLILCAVKDRDIAARGNGDDGGVGDMDIRAILEQMIEQRKESAKLFAEGGRCELADQEETEIGIIREFLPKQMNADEIRGVCENVVEELGATCIRDMGRTMSAIKTRYPGQMDFHKASSVVKEMLS